MTSEWVPVPMKNEFELMTSIDVINVNMINYVVIDITSVTNWRRLRKLMIKP